jgi:hypothetical protein
MRWPLRLALAAVVLGAGVLAGWWVVTAGERSRPGKAGTMALGRNGALGGARLFPEDNHWNLPIDDRPVDPASMAYLVEIGLSTPLHPDFGTNRLGNVVFGIPYLVVSGAEVDRWHQVPFDYGSQSDPGPYPIPDNPPIEEGGDHHLLVLDRDSNTLYEIFNLHLDPGWEAGSGAIWDLSSNVSRPRGWTSADAAGLAILPGLVRADEVYDVGEVRHALRFTLRRTRNEFIYPGRHRASRIADPMVPPMGLRLRLRADVDLTELPAGARVIAEALQRYGMILADNGGPLFVTGTADRRWRRRDTEALKRFTAGDFEVIVPPPPPVGDTVAWAELRKGLAGFSER